MRRTSIVLALALLSSQRLTAEPGSPTDDYSSAVRADAATLLDRAAELQAQAEQLALDLRVSSLAIEDHADRLEQAGNVFDRLYWQTYLDGYRKLHEDLQRRYAAASEAELRCRRAASTFLQRAAQVDGRPVPPADGAISMLGVLQDSEVVASPNDGVGKGHTPAPTGPGAPVGSADQVPSHGSFFQLFAQTVQSLFAGPLTPLPLETTGSATAPVVTDYGDRCFQVVSPCGRTQICGNVTGVTPLGDGCCQRVCFAGGRCIQICQRPDSYYSLAVGTNGIRLCDAGGCTNLGDDVASVKPLGGGRYQVCRDDGTCTTVTTSWSMTGGATTAGGANGTVQKIRDGSGRVVETRFTFVDQDGVTRRLSTPADVEYRYGGGYEVQRYIKYTSCNGSEQGFWDRTNVGPSRNRGTSRSGTTTRRS